MPKIKINISNFKNILNYYKNNSNLYNSQSYIYNKVVELVKKIIPNILHGYEDYSGFFFTESVQVKFYNRCKYTKVFYINGMLNVSIVESISDSVPDLKAINLSYYDKSGKIKNKLYRRVY